VGQTGIKPRPVAVFLLLGLIWGSEWLPTRAVEMPLLRSLATQYAVAALLLGGIIAVRRIGLPRRRQLMAMAITGVTFAALPAILTVWARERISPGLLVVILAMTPLIAALLEGRAEGVWLAPLIGGVGGTALLASQGLSFSSQQWTGGAGVLLAAVLIAGSVIYVKRKLSEAQPIVIAAVQLATAAICVALASLAIEGHLDLAWTRSSAILEVSLAIFGRALAYPLYYWLVRRMESFQVTSSLWVATAAGVAESLILVRHGPSWRIASGIVILAASLWALWRTGPGDEEPFTLAITPPHSGE